MLSLSQIKNYAVTSVCVLGRTIFHAGQTLYSVGKFFDYIHASPKVSATFTGCAILGTMTATVMGKTLSTYKQLQPKTNTVPLTETENPPPLGWMAWGTQCALKVSGITYGVINALSAYFLTVVLSETLNKLMTSTDEISPAKMVGIQTGALLIAGTTFFTYLAYDYKLIKSNIKLIVTAVEKRQFKCDKAMAKTLALSAFNLLTYPLLAYFYARPTLRALPYIGSRMGPIVENCITAFACTGTFGTVISWLPSVHIGLQSTKPDLPQLKVPVTLKSVILNGIAFISGAIDSLGNNGVGTFIGFITTCAELGFNPYGVIISVGTICGSNTAIGNYLFSIEPARKEILKALYDKQNILPLITPINESDPFSSYTPKQAIITEIELETADPSWPKAQGPSEVSPLISKTSEPKNKFYSATDHIRFAFSKETSRGEIKSEAKTKNMRFC